jgi:serine/threonine-protein kinase
MTGTATRGGEDPLERTIAARVATLSALSSTCAADRTVSMRPQSAGDLVTLRNALSKVASIAPPADVPLRIERTLGEGGMGVVQLATQTSLGRKVAAKRVREDGAPADAATYLLREAWVTGSLEHPNVVPVYDIVRSTQGEPVIVLKRIEGVHWGELIGDADSLHRRLGEGDPLELDLGILLQVCNAVHFAHSRGVVHRDLKPENVMIGTFGEVYVLDWGIAVDVGVPADSPLKPLLGVGRHDVAGTPAYMAPEMIDGVARVGVHTDVYLLGGILHEILTGKPPHDVADIVGLVRSITTSTPSFPPSAPPELVDLCERALSREPAQRPPSAEAFRLELVAFLRHRGSAQLAAAAQARLERLRTLLKSAGRRTVAPADERRRAYDLFSECRFAFQQALREWPENAPARTGLDDATVAMIEYELGQDDARAASALVGELSAPPPELLARVDAAVRAQDERRERMRKLERSADQSVSRPLRTVLVSTIGFLWGTLPLLRNALGDASSHGYVVAVAGLSGFTVLLGAVFRHALLGAPFNRRIYFGLLLHGLLQLVILWALMALGASRDVAETGAYFVWVCFAVAGTILVDTAGIPWALACLLTLAWMVRWPEHRPVAWLAGYAGFLGTVAIRWARDYRKPQKRAGED